MKINRITWENFKGLSDGEICADGHDVFIKGKNGSGKTSIAEIPAFVLFGKFTGSVKAYDNGIAPTKDGLIHAAEITFDNGDTLRREIFWNGCNSAALYINGNKVALAKFNAHVQKLTNNGGYSLLNPFFFCELPPKEQRNFLLSAFRNNDTDIFNLPEFKGAEKLFDGLSADLFKERAKLELKRTKPEADNIPARIDELIIQRANLPTDLNAEKTRLADEIQKAQAELDSLNQNNSNLKSEYDGIVRQISTTKNIKERLERQLANAKSTLEILRKQYRQVANTPRGKCPTCGQIMPQELFEAKRDEKLINICEDGTRFKADVANLQADLQNVSAELDNLDKRANQLAAQIQAQADNDKQRAEKISTLRNLLAELNLKLANVNKATENQSRIDELTTRGKELGKRITELEGHIKFAERFQQKKIELLEGHINDQFNFIKFKLFNLLVTTGELKETCEPMLNGVPYNALSSGEKLKCALDILNTLQTLYGVQLPLFIDNAEAYTLNSFVDLPNQKFLFKVDEGELYIDVLKETADNVC